MTWLESSLKRLTPLFSKNENIESQRIARMNKKYILLILVSTSAFIIILSTNRVHRTHSTIHKYVETFAELKTSLPNVAAAWNGFTQSRIKNIRKIYFQSWDNIITSYATKYVIDGADLCTALSPSLLVFVLSLPINTKERQAIRSTWGGTMTQKSSYFNTSTKLVFMVGRMTNPTVSDRLLQEESTMYKDIVQFDFFESRYNLTRKMMYGLRWIKTYCNSVKYILKVDDDTFINVARLSEYLLRDPDINNKTIHGYRYGGGVLRTGKYAVKKNELPSSKYPPYVSGTSYILPYDSIPDMLDLAERLPYCPVDDAFMTGVMRAILEINIKHSAHFTHMAERKITPCLFHSKIAVTNTNINCVHMLWNLATQDGAANCNQSKSYDKKVCSIFR
ncbi:hypothetical protein ACJMK2_021767 [Sinanodonta woodiana]|uniref:Hexosyltransferase n=1 Tax=Sinanodonta woodiana TaxID=1069815 RepID=A0ABD3TH15_SINWO